ncbi:MAG: enoyl-CoA hydratase/carnithine racemase [Acidimicrobiales bacterium]|jgi:enoyl-CoA hydratase/carnithine racemase
MTDLIVIERPVERVAHVVLNRPERRNALIGPLADQLGDALESLNADDSVSVVVIRGAGHAFCSGLDLKAFSEEPQPDWVPIFAEKWQRVHRALFNSDRIVIGALERAAVNGGAALALACDFLVAGDGAFLQVGEIQQGMAAPMNMAWLRLRHSEALAARIALLGDRLTGSQLVDLGIALVSVPDGDGHENDVVEAADQLAGRLAAHDPMGAKRIKASLRRTGRPESAEDWFAQAVAADPLAGVRLKPRAAENK